MNLLIGESSDVRNVGSCALKTDVRSCKATIGPTIHKRTCLRRALVRHGVAILKFVNLHDAFVACASRWIFDDISDFALGDVSFSGLACRFVRLVIRRRLFVASTSTSTRGFGLVVVPISATRGVRVSSPIAGLALFLLFLAIFLFRLIRHLVPHVLGQHFVLVSGFVRIISGFS